MHGAVIIMSTLISVLCSPLPSLHPFDFYEICLLLVIIIIVVMFFANNTFLKTVILSWLQNNGSTCRGSL